MALLVAGLATGLYLFSMAPTVTFGGDCGELIAASYVLGNAHPTGYPLYLVLGKILSYVPVGEVAFRYNLLSVAAGGVTVGCAYQLCRALQGNVAASALAALFVSTTYFFWSQCIIAEVYALSMALFAAVLYCLLRWRVSNDGRWLLSGGFLLGLAAANHLTVLLFVPALGAFVLLVSVKEKKGVGGLVPAAAFFAAALLLYLYLPVRAHRHPGLNWGNPDTIGRFWDHVRGAMYAYHLRYPGLGELATRASAYLGVLCLQFLLMAPVGAAGVVAAIVQSPLAGGLLLLCALMNVAFSLCYHVGDIWLYFLPSFLVFGVFVGCGLTLFEGALSRTMGKWKGMATFGMLRLVPVYLLCFSVWVVYPRATLRKNQRALQPAEQILALTPSGARIFIQSDETLFPLWYLQHVYGRGTDRVLVSVSNLPDQIRRKHLLQRLRNVAARPTFVTFWPQQVADKFLGEALGPVVRVLPPNERSSLYFAALEGREPKATWPTGAAALPSLPGDAVRRDGLCTFMVFWRPHSGLPAQYALDMTFTYGKLKKASPPARPEQVRIRPFPSINEQVVQWTRRWRLAGGRALAATDVPAGRWVKEAVAVDVPNSVLPGVYRCFLRLRGCEDRLSADAWREVGTMEITDR